MVISTSYVQNLVLSDCFTWSSPPPMFYNFVLLDCFTWSSPPPMFTTGFCWIVLHGHLYFLCSQLCVVGLFDVVISTSYVHNLVLLDCFYLVISTSYIHNLVFLYCLTWSSPPHIFTIGLFYVVISTSYVQNLV